MKAQHVVSAIIAVFLCTTVSNTALAADFVVHNTSTHIVGDVVIDLDNNEQRTVYVGANQTSLIDIGSANVLSLTANGHVIPPNTVGYAFTAAYEIELAATSTSMDVVFEGIAQ